MALVIGQLQLRHGAVGIVVLGVLDPGVQPSRRDLRADPSEMRHARRHALLVGAHAVTAAAAAFGEQALAVGNRHALEGDGCVGLFRWGREQEGRDLADLFVRQLEVRHRCVRTDARRVFDPGVGPILGRRQLGAQRRQRRRELRQVGHSLNVVAAVATLLHENIVAAAHDLGALHAVTNLVAASATGLQVGAWQHRREPVWFAPVRAFDRGRRALALMARGAAEARDIVTRQQLARVGAKRLRSVLEKRVVDAAMARGATIGDLDVFEIDLCDLRWRVLHLIQDTLPTGDLGGALPRFSVAQLGGHPRHVELLELALIAHPRLRLFAVNGHDTEQQEQRAEDRHRQTHPGRTAHHL